MPNRYCFFLLFASFILQACNTSKPALSMEYHDPDSSSNYSTLILPIKLFKSELEKSINTQLGETLYVDDDFSDGLLVRATRQSDVSLTIEDQKVSYKVPVGIWVKKDVILTAVEAEGSLELEFETAYSVHEDWQFETNTILKSYTWTKSPVVKLGIGNINVTSIANQFIEKAKGELASSIDEQVAQMIDLKAEINRAWEEMQKPVFISPEYNSWLLMNPESISLTPLKTVNDQIESTVVVTAKPQIKLGDKPESGPQVAMPGFNYIDVPPEKEFSIYFGSEIPFVEAEKIAKAQMLGETFSYGKRKVKVEDIIISGKGNKLMVSTLLSGSYEGLVAFTAKPDYVSRKNEITLKDVDFEFDTKNKLIKTASWLFKGSLKKTLQENLNFHLNENLQVMQQAIEHELENYELAPGVSIVGNLNELNVSHIYVGSTGVNVKVGLIGKMRLEIKDIARR